MNSDHNNSGIVISGKGTLNAEVVAVGYQARAQKIAKAADSELAVRGLTELQVSLEALITALTVHGDKLSDQVSAFGLAERVSKELSVEKPDKIAMRGFLTALADEAKSVVDISKAALSLKDLVAAIF